MSASILGSFVVLFVHNWASRPTGRAGDRMEICLMRPGERETEGPDYKQTKHFYIFWAAMWRTFIWIKCPLARFWTCCTALLDVWCSCWGVGKEKNSSQWKSIWCKSKYYWNMYFITWNLAGRVVTLYVTLANLINNSLRLLVVCCLGLILQETECSIV